MADFEQRKVSFWSHIVRLFFWLVWFLTQRRQNQALWQRKQIERSARILPRRRHTRSILEKAGSLHGEWIIPDGQLSDKVIYYLHGGAFAMCSVATHRRLISNIAHACKAKAFALEYTLCPEEVFPVALLQAVEGYRFLLSKGIKPQDIIISGDSAGGGLSVTTMLKLKELGLPLPGKAVLLSPWTDLEGIGSSNTSANPRDPINNFALQYYGKLYIGKEDIRNPLISPIYADLTGMPPILIQISESELIRDDGLRLAERARMFGVDVTVQMWHGQAHVWQIFDLILPEAGEAIKMIGEWAR